MRDVVHKVPPAQVDGDLPVGRALLEHPETHKGERWASELPARCILRTGKSTPRSRERRPGPFLCQFCLLCPHLVPCFLDMLDETEGQFRLMNGGRPRGLPRLQGNRGAPPRPRHLAPLGPPAPSWRAPPSTTLRPRNRERREGLRGCAEDGRQRSPRLSLLSMPWVWVWLSPPSLASTQILVQGRRDLDLISLQTGLPESLSLRLRLFSLPPSCNQFLPF